MLDSAIKEQLKGLFAQLDAHYTSTSLSTLGMKAVPSWWICWKKWLLVPKNSPVVCKRAKV